MLICYVANHLADYSEYRTMNVTWYKDLKVCKPFVVMECYLTNQTVCLEMSQKLFATIHNSVIFILM